MIRVLMGLLLVGLGTPIVVGGVRAAKEQRYEFGLRSGKKETYVGPEARRVGAGLISFGSLLALWGFLLVPAPRPGWNAGHRVVALLSLGLMLATMALLFPPWRVHQSPSAAAFYGGGLMTGLFLWQSAALSKYSSPAFFVLILAAIGLGVVYPFASVGLVLGFFAAGGVALHLGILAEFRSP